MKVLFLLQRPESWINIESVWMAMQARGTFTLTLWVLPYHIGNAELSRPKLSETRRLLEDLQVEYHLWTESDSLEAGEYDVVVLTNPYDSERHSHLRFPRVSEAIPVTVYVPYGLAVGGGKKNYRLQYAQPVHIGCTLLPARSEWEREQYRRARGSDPHNVEVLGHPRFDSVSKRYSAMAAERPRSESTRTTVLWNSHFSFGRKYTYTSNFSTLDLLGPEILDFALNNRARMRLWWRPHPGTLSALVKEGILSSRDLPVLRDELATVGIHLDEAPDHLPAFLESDALISDVGSFLLEYLITEKPMLALLDPRGEGVNEEAAFLVGETGSASDPVALRDFLDGLVSGKTPPSTRDLRSHLLPMVDGRAGERLVDRIEAICQQAGLGKSKSLKVCGQARSRPSRAPSALQTMEPLPIQPNHATPVLDHLRTRLRELREHKNSVGRVEFEGRRLAGVLRTELVERAKLHPLLSGPVLWLRDLFQERQDSVK